MTNLNSLQDFMKRQTFHPPQSDESIDVPKENLLIMLSHLVITPKLTWNDIGKHCTAEGRDHSARRGLIHHGELLGDYGSARNTVAGRYDTS